MANSRDSEISQKDLYKIVLETRNFEISMFWRRANYFLLVNTALGVGFFSAMKPNGVGLMAQIIIAIAGVLVSSLWLNVNLGSKFWQSRWEWRLRELEENIDQRIGLFFSDSLSIKSDVMNSLGESRHHRVQQIIDSFVLEKPSVTSQALYLSLLFMTFWGSLYLYSLVKFVCPLGFPIIQKVFDDPLYYVMNAWGYIQNVEVF